MSTKKKLIISLTSLAVILVVAIVSVVAVFAALNTEVTSSFNISYTAQGVEATIKANYRIATIGEESVGSYTVLKEKDSTNEQIVFAGTETESGEKTKSFEDLEEKSITKNQYFVFKYEIKNDSADVDMKVAYNIANTETPKNFNVYYAFTTEEGDLTSSLDVANLSTSDVFKSSFTEATIEKSGTGYLYVVFTIENTDKNATFEGTSNWTLTAI